MSRTFEELTVDTNVSAWIPTEAYSDLILESVVCYGDLSLNGITAIEYDLGAGKGDTVNVRIVRPRTGSCASGGCPGVDNCLSVASQSLLDEKIQIHAWGDYDKICAFTSWKTNGNLLQIISKEMAKRMAKCRDAAMWTLLCNETAVTTTVKTAAVYSGKRVTTGSCCTYSFDLYNSIVSARQSLSGACYNPDTVLIHPYAAAYLYYKEGNSAPFMGTYNPMVKFDSDTGHLASILGMRVIEVGVAVADDSDPCTAGDEVAFVIDSSRAIGEAFGQRPTFNTFYDGKCDATQLTCWQYWGAAIIDPAAIATITS